MPEDLRKEKGGKSALSKEILENYDLQKQRYLQAGYKETQETISIKQANVMAFVTAGPFVLVELIVWIKLGNIFSADFSMWDITCYVVLFMLCIFIHELLHGIGWMVWGKQGFKSIHLGIMQEYMNPYCHCKEPLKPVHYLIGCAAPFLVLGIGFFIAAIISGSPMLLVLSVSNVSSAGGDTMIMNMLAKYLGRKDCYILDHPEKCGFVAFLK
ncbi:MAG: DUF3267 domain-containing protein [Dorea sp.]|uniref:DUF3267 domain-containing protein n=1 Tax=Sporofaciens musculi TaxID=2681861 RepID=UPI0021728C21|nr:DUF3267 domain-containing protein [Sporofaciens musculi]MCI9423719.1 DUF3267 domain-containing protein [Dorea sp.]